MGAGSIRFPGEKREGGQGTVRAIAGIVAAGEVASSGVCWGELWGGGA